MKDQRLDAPLDRASIQRLYNRIGRRYDLLRFAESAPKRWAIAQLAVQPGERVLEVGVGTGTVLAEFQRVLRPGGRLALVWLSPGSSKAAPGLVCRLPTN